MALNWFGSLRDSSSNFDPQKKFVFFVFFVEKNRTLISDLIQSNFKVLLIAIAGGSFSRGCKQGNFGV